MLYMYTYGEGAREDTVVDVVIARPSPVLVSHTDGMKHHGTHSGVLQGGRVT